MRSVHESLSLNAVHIGELAVQYGGVREREGRGLIAWFQTTVNLSVDLNRNFVLDLNSVSELEYNVCTDTQDKFTVSAVLT